MHPFQLYKKCCWIPFFGHPPNYELKSEPYNNMGQERLALPDIHKYIIWQVKWSLLTVDWWEMIVIPPL